MIAKLHHYPAPVRQLKILIFLLIAFVICKKAVAGNSTFPITSASIEEPIDLSAAEQNPGFLTFYSREN